MKKMMKVFVFTVLIFCCLMFTLEANAKRRYSRRRRFSLYRALKNPAITAKAGINSRTRNKALAILNNARKNARFQRKKLGKYYSRISSEYKKGKVNLNRILTNARTIHNFRWQIRKTSLTARVRVMNLLTLIQRKKLRQEYYNLRK